MIVNIISCECLDYTPEISFEVCESTEVYNADGSFNRLRIVDKDFDNMDFKTINKETVKNINSHRGEVYKITETNNSVIIDKKTSREYSFSKYSQSLNINTKKLKGILSKYFKEIISNFFNRKFVNYKKAKHVKDAKYGFYRYKIVFSIKDEVKENIYEAVVLIRNSEDKKKYLYDILDIKKLINPASEPWI